MKPWHRPAILTVKDSRTGQILKVDVGDLIRYAIVALAGLTVSVGSMLYWIYERGWMWVLMSVATACVWFVMLKMLGQEQHRRLEHARLVRMMHDEINSIIKYRNRWMGTHGNDECIRPTEPGQ